MKNGESFRDRVVKHFFNISGDFDEYKRQEANRIGTNAMLFCLPALFLGPLVALFWATTAPETALAGLIMFNVAFIALIICPYIMTASRRAHLTDHEVSAKDMAAARWHILGVAIGLTLYFGIFMYLEQAFLDTLFDKTPLMQGLTSSHNIQGAVVSGVFFGVFMGLIDLVRLKKQ